MSDTPQKILGTILSNLPGLLALKDKRLAYTVANPRFCQFLGKSPNEIVGKTDAELFPAAEAGVCAQEDQGVIKSGMARDGEIQLTGKAGARWFAASRAPMLDENGDPAGVMFTAYDVTEFKQREMAVAGAEAKITEAQQRATAAEAQAQEALGNKAELEDLAAKAEAQAREQQEFAAKGQSELQALRQQLDDAAAASSAAQEGLRQQLLAAEQERVKLGEQVQQLQAQHQEASEARARAAHLAQQLSQLLQ